jgi:uncharacterized protein DUF6717
MPATLYPYRIGKTWVFDDQRTGLKEEAFVLGMSEMITKIVDAKHLPDAANGFAMTFNDESFDDTDVVLVWLREEEPGEPMNGNWYRALVAGEYMEGWLCPALYLYFQKAPKFLYVRADALPANIDPIWHVEEGQDDIAPYRFVAPE